MEPVPRHGSGLGMLSAVAAQPGNLHERFSNARPFPHVVIDGFFEESLARALLAEFPSRAGSTKKITHPDLAAVGPRYAQLDRYLRSEAFSAWIEAVTGIAGLTYDPTNFGGGTHENFAGAELPPHVDFNYHPLTRLHRRVNAIVYLNEGWQRHWGGAIQFYRDPRDDAPSAEYEPSFNRCIIFETSERSWHGFDRIAPTHAEALSRKSISIYLYTRDRPDEQIAGDHTTLYVPRPLPERYVDGYTLTAQDAHDLRAMVRRRDALIELYQGDLRRREPDSATAARLRIRCAELEAAQALPVLGYVRTADCTGRYADGWAGAELSFTMRAVRTVRALNVHLRVPHGADAVVTLAAGETNMRQRVSDYGEMTMTLDVPAGESRLVRISTDTPIVPRENGTGADERTLGLFLEMLVFEHQ